MMHPPIALTVGTVFAALLTACGSTQTRTKNTGVPSADHLATVLTGSFSSAEQAAMDPDNFFDIRLQAVRIWNDRDDGPWLYVEQAAATSLDRPYRQRVYQLSKVSDEQWRSRVYTMPEPMRFAGLWQTPEAFDTMLSPAELEERAGCAIDMTWNDQLMAYVGSTVGRGCVSTINGASYATSIVTLYNDKLVTWDRGFDTDGDQVWGATTGGYEFIRTAD